MRVTGKKRDDLQEAIALLRTKEFDMPLQFQQLPRLMQAPPGTPMA